MIFNNKSISVKKSNELVELLNLIQSRTGHTMEQIGERIDRSQEHMSRLKKEPAEKAQRTVRLLKERYKNELKEDRILDTDQIRTLNASVGILIGEVAFLRSLATGESPEVIQQRLKKSCQDAIKNL